MHKTIYFVRHCEPNYQNHHDEKRELTDKGVLDSQALVDWFDGVAIDGIYCTINKAPLWWGRMVRRWQR